MQLRDQLEFVFEIGAYLGGNALRIAAGSALISEVRQCILGIVETIHLFIGIFIAQLVEREGKFIAKRQRFFDCFRRIAKQPHHFFRWLQMSLGIYSELAPRTIYGGLLANAGEHVGERPPVGVMIEHIIDCDQRYAGVARMVIQPHKPRAVAAAIKHGGSKTDAMWHGFTQAREERSVCRHHDQLKPEGMRQQVVEIKSAGAFLGAQITESEQAGESSPPGAIAWIGEDVGRAVGKHEPCAGMIAQWQVLLALCQMCAHHAGNGIAIT